MTDDPGRAIETMRRQLELVRDLDDDVVDAILSVEENPAISSLGLEERDAMLLRRMGFDSRETLFSLDPADVDVLLEVSDQIQLLGPSQYSDHRHEFVLRRNLILAKEVGGLAAALDDREAAEAIVRHINDEKNGSPETNKDYRTAFRTFGDLVTDGEGPPPSIEWVPGGYPSNYDPAPQPEKMYRWDDHVVPMLEACHNDRDRALIALAWDLGPRPSELFDLTLNRFSDHKYGMKVTLYGGKRGTRSPLIHPSIPYVTDWLENHPAPEGSDSPLWVGVGSDSLESVSNNRIRDVLKERARAADMSQPSTPTPSRFRKSSASYLASQSDVSQPDLEDHHGWQRGSPVAGRYVAVFGDAHDRSIAAAHGMDVEADSPEPKGPVPCVRCGELTPRHKDSCIKCGAPMSREAAMRAEKAQEERSMSTAYLAQEYDIPPEEADAISRKLVDDRLRELGLLDHPDSSSSS